MKVIYIPQSIWLTTSVTTQDKKLLKIHKKHYTVWWSSF